MTDNAYTLAGSVVKKINPDLLVLLLALGFITFIWWSQQGKFDDFQDKLITRVEKLESEVARLSRENTQLRIENARNQGLYASIPIPIWSNWRDGLIRRVNPAYAAKYYAPRGLTPQACIDKPNSACWPKEVAKGFDKHNDMVLRQRRPLVFCELLPNGKLAMFIKYPSYSGTEVIGVDGMEVPGGYCKQQGVIDFEQIKNQ